MDWIIVDMNGMRGMEWDCYLSIEIVDSTIFQNKYYNKKNATKQPLKGIIQANIKDAQKSQVILSNYIFDQQWTITQVTFSRTYINLIH